MIYAELNEKRFDNEKRAEEWARAFDYARSLLGLPPLRVMKEGDGWLVTATRLGEQYQRSPMPDVGSYLCRCPR